MSIYAEWLHAKNQEKLAVERRRQIEDEILASDLAPDFHEGTFKFGDEGYAVTLTYRMNKKIDADLVQEIAAEHGISNRLGELFRWKPEINKKVWDATSPEITKLLDQAITTSMGRPSFKIEQEAE